MARRKNTSTSSKEKSSSRKTSINDDDEEEEEEEELSSKKPSYSSQSRDIQEEQAETIFYDESNSYSNYQKKERNEIPRNSVELKNKNSDDDGKRQIRNKSMESQNSTQSQNQKGIKKEKEIMHVNKPKKTSNRTKKKTVEQQNQDEKSYVDSNQFEESNTEQQIMRERLKIQKLVQPLQSNLLEKHSIDSSDLIDHEEYGKTRPKGISRYGNKKGRKKAHEKDHSLPLEDQELMEELFQILLQYEYKLCIEQESNKSCQNQLTNSFTQPLSDQIIVSDLIKRESFQNFKDETRYFSNFYENRQLNIPQPTHQLDDNIYFQYNQSNSPNPNNLREDLLQSQFQQSNVNCFSDPYPKFSSQNNTHPYDNESSIMNEMKVETNLQYNSNVVEQNNNYFQFNNNSNFNDFSNQINQTRENDQQFLNQNPFKFQLGGESSNTFNQFYKSDQANQQQNNNDQLYSNHERLGLVDNQKPYELASLNESNLNVKEQESLSQDELSNKNLNARKKYTKKEILTPQIQRLQQLEHKRLEDQKALKLTQPSRANKQSRSYKLVEDIKMIYIMSQKKITINGFSARYWHIIVVLNLIQRPHESLRDRYKRFIKFLTRDNVLTIINWIRKNQRIDGFLNFIKQQSQFKIFSHISEEDPFVSKKQPFSGRRRKGSKKNKSRSQESRSEYEDESSHGSISPKNEEKIEQESMMNNNISESFQPQSDDKNEQNDQQQKPSNSSKKNNSQKQSKPKQSSKTSSSNSKCNSKLLVKEEQQDLCNDSQNNILMDLKQEDTKIEKQSVQLQIGNDCYSISSGESDSDDLWQEEYLQPQFQRSNLTQEQNLELTRKLNQKIDTSNNTDSDIHIILTTAVTESTENDINNYNNSSIKEEEDEDKEEEESNDHGLYGTDGNYHLRVYGNQEIQEFKPSSSEQSDVQNKEQDENKYEIKEEEQIEFQNQDIQHSQQVYNTQSMISEKLENSIDEEGAQNKQFIIEQHEKFQQEQEKMNSKSYSGQKDSEFEENNNEMEDYHNQHLQYSDNEYFNRNDQQSQENDSNSLQQLFNYYNYQNNNQLTNQNRDIQSMVHQPNLDNIII